MRALKCLLDFVDQRHNFGESIDYEQGGILHVNDDGDYHCFEITDEQLEQLEENPSIELALKFKKENEKR
jgi:hypothetical protein